MFQSIVINFHLFIVSLPGFGITWETQLWHVCEGVSGEVCLGEGKLQCEVHHPTVWVRSQTEKKGRSKSLR